MAISFPRAMPTCGAWEPIPFSLVYQEARALTGGGSPAVVSLGPAVWQGRWAIRTIGRADFAEWSAWADSLRSGLRLFKATPPKWKWPRAYPRGFAGLTVGGSPFSGLGSVQAIAAGFDTLTIDELPVGFVLAPGDWLSIPVGSRQHLHKVTEGGTASAGGVVTVSVEPTIRPNAAVDTAVRLEAPYCDMALSAPPEMTISVSGDGLVSFEAMQVLI